MAGQGAIVVTSAGELRLPQGSYVARAHELGLSFQPKGGRREGLRFDEDPRADRQVEFTQVDVEMSFIDMEDIISVTEGQIRIRILPISEE